MSEANDKDDEALDGYLSSDNELSRRYRRGGSPQPSASIDRVILEAAREETAAATTPPRRFKPMWERPLTIAAVVVLSSIVVVAIQREAGLFPPQESETQRAQDYRNGDAAPATGRSEQRPAAPEPQADALMERPAPSRAPDNNEARSDGASALRGIVAPESLKRERQEAAALKSQAPAADDPISDALSHIRKTWEAGETQRAEELLESFREQYPEVGEERLREGLPEGLLSEDQSP